MYNNINITGATSSTAFGCTGKPTDAATGLYYSGVRFYDPASGRFTTLDRVRSTLTMIIVEG